MPPKQRGSSDPVPVKVEGLIHLIRGHRVMLDSDLAKLYGVETRAINQAVQRNLDRFPDDFAFRLSEQEFDHLRSQNVISSSGYGGRRHPPWAFTEHGVAGLSGVLRSPTAGRVYVEIMRAFVRMRQVLATPGEIVVRLEQLAETVQLHDEQIRQISDVLRRMLTPPPAPPKRPIGFRSPEPTPSEASS